MARRPRLPLLLGLAALTSLAHALFVAAHLLLHHGLAIPIARDALIWALLAGGPLVALALPLRADRPRAGAALLAVVMLAGAVWSLWAHYAADGLDAVAAQDADAWGRLYGVTSQMLLAFQLQGLALGALLLARPQVPRQAETPAP